METNFSDENNVLIEELNRKLSDCVEVWRMEYSTRNGAEADYTQQKQLGALVKESIEKGNRLNVVLKKTEGNAQDLEEFLNKTELPNGEYEVEVKSLLVPGSYVLSDKPSISLPPGRSLVSIVGISRRLLTLYPDEILSMTAVDSKK